MTAKEVCEALGVSQPRLRTMVASGEGPQPLRTGTRNRLWARHSVEAYLGYTAGVCGTTPQPSIDGLRESVTAEVIDTVIDVLVAMRPEGRPHGCT
jgi:predicted DNA-binding transcriptional regulator AlpA